MAWTPALLVHPTLVLAGVRLVSVVRLWGSLCAMISLEHRTMVLACSMQLAVLSWVEPHPPTFQCWWPSLST